MADRPLTYDEIRAGIVDIDRTTNVSCFDPYVMYDFYNSMMRDNGTHKRIPKKIQQIILKD